MRRNSSPLNLTTIPSKIIDAIEGKYWEEVKQFLKEIFSFDKNINLANRESKSWELDDKIKVINYLRVEKKRVIEFIDNINYFKDKDWNINWGQVAFYFGLTESIFSLKYQLIKEILKTDLGETFLRSLEEKFTTVDKDKVKSTIERLWNEYIFLGIIYI